MLRFQGGGKVKGNPRDKYGERKSRSAEDERKEMLKAEPTSTHLVCVVYYARDVVVSREMNFLPCYSKYSSEEVQRKRNCVALTLAIIDLNDIYIL